MKQESKQDIVLRLTEGLNAQQRSVPQLPADAQARKIKVLGAKTDPQHPFAGYAVGADESAEPGKKTIGPDKNDPFEKGWRAGFRHDESNPYPAGSKEAAQWDRGYAEAEAQPNHYDESALSEFAPGPERDSDDGDDDYNSGDDKINTTANAIVKLLKSRQPVYFQSPDGRVSQIRKISPLNVSPINQDADGNIIGTAAFDIVSKSAGGRNYLDQVAIQPEMYGIVPVLGKKIVMQVADQNLPPHLKHMRDTDGDLTEADEPAMPSRRGFLKKAAGAAAAAAMPTGLAGAAAKAIAPAASWASTLSAPLAGLTAVDLDNIINLLMSSKPESMISGKDPYDLDIMKSIAQDAARESWGNPWMEGNAAKAFLDAVELGRKKGMDGEDIIQDLFIVTKKQYMQELKKLSPEEVAKVKSQSLNPDNKSEPAASTPSGMSGLARAAGAQIGRTMKNVGKATATTVLNQPAKSAALPAPAASPGMQIPKQKARVAASPFNDDQRELDQYVKEEFNRHPDDINEESGAVVAHGYAYNRQDQRVAWTREFASEAEAKEWARRRNATVLSIVPKDSIEEGWKSKLAGAALAGSMALGGSGIAHAQGDMNHREVVQQIQSGKIQNAEQLLSVIRNAKNIQTVWKMLQFEAKKAGMTEYATNDSNGINKVIQAISNKKTNEGIASGNNPAAAWPDFGTAKTYESQLAEAKQRLAEAESRYVLYWNGKPQTHYATEAEAKRIADSIKAKHPTVKIEIKNEMREDMAEGARVDRMVKHIASSEKKTGKSKKDAESIAWATVNKRGYLDNKNKKKHVAEAGTPADIRAKNRAVVKKIQGKEADIDEGWKSKLAGAALAGAAAFGGGGAQAQTTAPTGVNATGNNAAIVQSLVNPVAQQRFAAQHADTTSKLTDPKYTHNPNALAQHQAAPKQQHDEWIQNVRNAAQFENPYQIIRIALNMAGVTPQEVLQNLPQGYKLPTTEPKTAPVRLPGDPGYVREDITQEDIITKLKARLGDYLSDLGQQIKKDPALQDKLSAETPGDQVGPPVKTLTTDDGHQISIHGNEDDGFRISIKNRQTPSKFDSLDEAVMACEMYRAHRRRQALTADYVDEA